MRHRNFGAKLGRNIKERKALFKNLTKSLLTHGSIETTEAKAKAVVPMVEKLVHAVCRYTEVNAKRELRRSFPDRTMVTRVYQSIIENISDATSRVTKITKVKIRQGDDSLIVKLAFIKPYTLKALPVNEVKEKVKKDVKPVKKAAPDKKEVKPVKKATKKVTK